MLATRENRRYLPRITLPAELTITSQIADVAGADVLVLATPVAELTDVVDRLIEAQIAAPLVSLAKGFIETPKGSIPWSLPQPIAD